MSTISPLVPAEIVELCKRLILRKFPGSIIVTQELYVIFFGMIFKAHAPLDHNLNTMNILQMLDHVNQIAAERGYGQYFFTLYWTVVTDKDRIRIAAFKHLQ